MHLAHADAPVLKVRTTEVLVPTLVEKHGGEVVYGLREGDFVLEDNGVAQKIHVQEEMDTAPVALVIAMEQGGASALEFDKFSKLGPLLDMFLAADARSQIALVGFDSQPHLLVDYTRSAEEVAAALKRAEPGDGGAAILDSVAYAVDLLETQPEQFRRVLLLLSEERDHGSRHIKAPALIGKIGRSDVLVLSVSFSPTRAELLHDLKDNGDDRTLHGENLIGDVLLLVQAFRKNVAKELAKMSGGEYNTFTFEKGFEEKVLNAAKHTRNRYLITFRPTNPAPGLHALRIHTKDDFGAKIIARANYWIEAEQ